MSNLKHIKTDKGEFYIPFVLSFLTADEFSKENRHLLPALSDKEAIAHLKEVYKKAVKIVKDSEPKKS